MLGFLKVQEKIFKILKTKLAVDYFPNFKKKNREKKSKSETAV